MRRLSWFVPPLMLAITPAFAHPRLVASIPANNATVAPTERIEMQFSERLVSTFVGATLEMIDMHGARMKAPMKLKVATRVGADGTSLVVVTPKPLSKGVYRLNWHVVSADTHRSEGSLGFKVQ